MAETAGQRTTPFLTAGVSKEGWGWGGLEVEEAELAEDSLLQATVHQYTCSSMRLKLHSLGNSHATVPPAGYKAVAQRQ